MTVVKAHYNGQVFVPETPVDLPVGYGLEIPVPSQAVESAGSKPPMLELLEILSHFPANPDWPADGAAEHDHYLYGRPKKS